MRYGIGVVGRVLRDSIWRPAWKLHKTWRSVAGVLATAGIGVAAYLSGAGAWLAGLPPIVWVAVVGWLLAVLFFARAFRLQIGADAAARRLGPVAERQAILDRVQAFIETGEAYLRFGPAEVPASIEPILRRWSREVWSYLHQNVDGREAAAFHGAKARHVEFMPPGTSHPDRVRQQHEIQGKVDFLRDLVRRLQQIGLPE